MSGYFITFEGIDGAGKTSVLNYVAKCLKDKGYQICQTFEPGASELGQGLRQILLNRQKEIICPESELLLFLADRAQHLTSLILPALKRGEIILCDRYGDSTLAYQGFACGLDLNLLQILHKFASHGLEANLTLVLDLSVEMARERLTKRLRSQNPKENLAKIEQKDHSEQRFDAEKIEFHTKVRQGFLTLARQNPERIQVIDASADFQTVCENCLKIILEKIK